MAFNPEPNKQAVKVLFSQKTNSPNHPLLFNGSNVSNVNVHKHLHLNLDPKLSFVSHINKKILDAYQLLSLVDDRNLYLYGHLYSLRLYENKHILLSTIIFIKETGRFS